MASMIRKNFSGPTPHNAMLMNLHAAFFQTKDAYRQTFEDYKRSRTNKWWNLQRNQQENKARG